MRQWVFIGLVCALPVSAVADDNLPWLNKSTPAPAAKPAPAPTGTLPWENAKTPVQNPVQPMQPMSQPVMKMDDPELRAMDDRKLNDLAMDYYDVSPTAKGAAERLATLQKRAKDLKKVLQGRGYDASDMVQDVTNLEARMTAARKKALAAQTPQAKADEVAQKAMETVKKMDAKPAAGN